MMSRLLFILIAVLFSLKGMAQSDQNENWDVMSVMYFSDGTSKYYHSGQPLTGYPEKDEILRRKYRRIDELQDDSIFIQRSLNKRASVKKGNVIIPKLEAVQYFIRPRRRINTKDSFTVLIRHKNAATNILNSGPTDSFTYYNINQNARTDTFFTEYIPFEKIEMDGHTAVWLDYKSSDTSLKEVGAIMFGSGSESESHYFGILGIYTSEYEQSLRTALYLYMADITAETPVLDSFPVYPWNLYVRTELLDTTHIIRYFVKKSKIDSTYVLKKIYLTRPKKMELYGTQENLIFLMNSFSQSKTYEYKLSPWDLYDDSHILWQSNAQHDRLLKIPKIMPGSYVLHIRDADHPEGGSVDYRIIIHPLWYQTLAFKIILPFVILLVSLLSIFYYNRKRAKKKYQILEAENEEVNMQMKSLHAQLNPHFIFNALNSIQGLISTGKYDRANQYLVDFSRLLRQTFDRHESKFWTLKEETELLKVYLRLEQLRLPFTLNFNSEEIVNQGDIPFPVLFLQPVVENAIKHGLPLNQDPILNIVYHRQDRNIIIHIEDNGKGFDPNHLTQRGGLKLTTDYINLINRQYPDSHVMMNIESTQDGTRIIFTFKNWIDE